jgi:two-component system sensor histidine kinase KdpD
MLSGEKEKNLNSILLYNTLFNSIAHELKTPISTIYGSTDNLLNNSDKLNEAHKNMLISEIHQASERLNDLVGNLLDISRLEAGYIHIKKDWCSMNELVFSVIDSLQRNLVKHRVKVEIDDQFPLVKIDYGLMEQVVSNIVLNATQYTAENTAITIQVILVENNLKISIFDNGSGVPDNEIDKIFDKFYSIKGKTINRTGLGLSIAKGFVQAHNGIIKAYNNEYSGLTFDITIPLSNNEIMNINTIE